MSIARWLPTLALATLLPAQVALKDLPTLARARAERLRPVQERALQPFWQDFALEYRGSAQFLDPRIKAAAGLGDGVVPLLLEKLQPVQTTATARNLAGNCRRVLELLDPAGFLDALVELLASGNEVARTEAIRLLGHAQTPRAAQILADLLDQTNPDEKLLTIGALARLKATAAAPKVAPLLGSSDRNVREAVLDYLIAAAPANVVDTVLQALSVESESKLWMQYVDYLTVAATENEAAAKALLPLLDHERLDLIDKKRLVQALAKVAPKGHDATQKRLHALLDGGDVESLGLQAALALRSLGDKTGVKKLQTALTEQLRKPAARKDPKAYERRGNLFLAIEEYGDAADDFEKVIEFSQSSLTSRKAHLNLARCESHKRRFSKVLDHLEKAAPTLDELNAMAQEDPAVQEALQWDKLRTFVQALKEPKDKDGKDKPK